MRIGLDVRYLSHGLVNGIHSYLENFIPDLIAQGAAHDFYLYADTKRPFELQSLPENVTLRLLPYRNPISSVYHDLRMWQPMAKDRLDIVHFTANYGFGPASARTVISLQDEINLLPWHQIVLGHRKNLRIISMMTYLHFCTTAAVRRADRLITASDYSRGQIARYGALSPGKIAQVPHACPRNIVRVTDADELTSARSRLGLARPFVLADAFKNPAVLARAWRLLPEHLRRGHEIIFFARSTHVLPVVHEAVEAGYARLLVQPDRRDLNALYSLAVAFVFPSWIEGFGIPLLEAMTCGAPIIASNRGSIPEVMADAGFLVDAEDEHGLSEYLIRLLEQPAERECLRQLGFARVKRFSWENIAKQVLSVYEQVLESPPRGEMPG